RVATIGDYDSDLAKVSIDDRLIPVRVQLTEESRSDLARISALRVPTATGGSVPLNAVADISVAEGPSVVNRLNRERVATIGANLPPGVVLGQATARFNEIVATVDLPASVRTAESGDAEIQGELFASFANAMLLALLLMLGVLILLFGSVIQPFTILLSLPLAIGGVAAALIITGSAISMPVLIGILMLMGIVTKNAILLVDGALQYLREGLSVDEALMKAGPRRLRPILMTSAAMAIGMVPTAIGKGVGSEFRAPMAIAVIGGVITSTFLTLLVVPVVFAAMERLGFKRAQKKDEELVPPAPPVVEEQQPGRAA
ncbi:efflux RND transporter permease subunit, partial [Archangium sp.]|uniref:efflux RND transporter permease subunit n=1 Tax=Archangium sp. TaxID=1872627 RepID=UPI00286C04BE